MEQAAIPHRVQVSGVDEDAIQHSDPAQLVQVLAKAKAQAVREACVDTSITAVLGCDSVLAFEGEVFGKPLNAAEAIARCQRMAGGWGELHTGHCLLPISTSYWSILIVAFWMRPCQLSCRLLLILPIVDF